MLGARLLARAQACARPLLAQSKHAFARSVGTAPSSAPPKTFLEAGQIDRGFVEGTAMLGAAIAAGTFVPFETQLSALKRVIDGFRAAGLRRDAIPDDVLVKDYLRKNALAAQNVLIASPSFYFLFSWITGQSVAVCTARAITGTMRIVPFMAFFYGAFALLAPFATQYYMRTGGTSYADSASNANMALMLGGARARASRRARCLRRPRSAPGHARAAATADERARAWAAIAQGLCSSRRSSSCAGAASRSAR